LEEMTAEVIPTEHELALARAAAVLAAGGLVAFPTDTVYGLAALPSSSEAVERLYAVKERPRNRPIPVLLSDSKLLERVASVPAQTRRLVESLVARFWPGGLTLVLPKTAAVPEVVTGGPSVAARVPDLQLARDLIREAGGVLAVTSANLSGRPSPCTAAEVEADLGKRIELILDGGPCPGGIPSTLLDCTASPPSILRHGAISAEDLRQVVDSVLDLD